MRILLNECVNLAAVMGVLERYGVPGCCMREIEILRRIQIDKLRCEVFVGEEWMRAYEEVAEKITKIEIIKKIGEAIEKSGRVKIEKRWEPGKMGVRYTGSVIVARMVDELATLENEINE